LTSSPPKIFALALKSGATRGVPVPSDARRRIPSVSTTFGVTTTLAPGNYDILLYSPDAAASLSDRDEYAVRFANPGVWEAATGMNRLVETAIVGK
jgi:hypothetical protein